MQEEVLKAGSIEFRKRENEIKVIKLELKECQRAYSVLAARGQAISSLDQRLLSYQTQLLSAKKESQLLSAALETPENSER